MHQLADARENDSVLNARTLLSLRIVLIILRLKVISAIAILLFAGMTWAGSKQILRIRDKKILVGTGVVPLSDLWLGVQPPPEHEPAGRLGFKSDVSKRNLLGLEREAPFALPRLSKVAPMQTKTLKILGIRVEFQEETPDDPQTTGNGLFDLRSQEEFEQQDGHLIDPSPHDTLFFNKHIEALNNYWCTVSESTLVLEGRVFPKSDTLAYRLPHPMAHYGAPDSSLSVKVEMLRQFFHDSFNLADSFSVYSDEPQIYQVDFSEYDCFVIFHAGLDLQSDLGQLVNPTPGDLFTGFIVLGDTVWVNNGAFPITEGTFMPETRSQDNRVTALNAVFAHEFGHQLGLVDLYNSQTFMTQVGDFALMDNNAQNVGVDVGYGIYVSGVLPVYPCGWSRAYLGFVEPVEITSPHVDIRSQNIELFAAEMLTKRLQLIKIPISPEEYFLLENRQVDLDGDHFSALRADSATNVILGPVDWDRNYNREYDWLLPGSGILIWHVDEEVAYWDYDGDGLNNFWDNDLQCDKDRRFLTIVEADGIIDFGGDYYTGFGQKEDMFYKGNNTELTPYTYPSSKSVNGSNTHIEIKNISLSDTVMTLDISQDWTQFGFPQKFIPETGISSLVSVKAGLQIFASSGRFIHAWGPGGSSVIPLSADSVQVALFDSTLVLLPLAIFAVDDSTFFGPPSLGDLDGDDTLEVVAATVDGRVCAWHPYDWDENGKADVVDGFPVDLEGTILVAPIIANFDSDTSDLEIFAATKELSNPRTLVISSNGAIIYSSKFEGFVSGLATTDSYNTNFMLRSDSLTKNLCIWDMYSHAFRACTDVCDDARSCVVGDIDRNDKLDVVFCCMEQGIIYAYDSDLNLLEGFPLWVNEKLKSSPVLGDIDKDGYLEIIVTSQNKIFAYNFNGTPVSNFPVTVSRPGGSTDLIDSSPILGDVDGDGYPDIIVGTKNKQILAYNKDARLVKGFPLATGGAVTSSPILLNLDKDANAELLTASDDGFIYAWELPGEYNEENFPWVMFGYDAGHTNYFPKDTLQPEPLAGDLLPANMAFNYPNPAKSQTKIRYFLKENAEVGIRIYDLSGMLVDDFPGPGVGQTHNECLWDCSKFASGVYLCRVEAKSENKNQVVFFKMAIVK